MIKNISNYTSHAENRDLCFLHLLSFIQGQLTKALFLRLKLLSLMVFVVQHS